MPARDFFAALASRADPEKIAGVRHSYLFAIEGEGRWLVEAVDGRLVVTEDPTGNDADVEIRTSSETFDRLASREQSPLKAYMTGKLKIDGDMNAALQLQKLL